MEVTHMPRAVKKTISLPFDLAKEVEEMAREERKTVSAVIQDVLRIAREERLKKGLRHIQGYWSSKAREKGVITDKDLERYLKI
jgi:metal-responsive CopG/Arc/MetJ family transcriptional regulator